MFSIIVVGFVWCTEETKVQSEAHEQREESRSNLILVRLLNGHEQQR